VSKTEKIKILYVDDEINNLVGFKASFRLDYTIITANNTVEALKHLKENPDIHIIFCDQRMPDKTGVQFFEDIRTEFPHPIRILLTAYADIESVIEAINRSNIFRYVKKPWIEVDIRSAIEESNRFYITNSLLSLKNEELQQAYNELDKFAYSVTHDIRRPLMSILGAVDVAQYIEDISELREMLSMMEESVMNLDVYIQNIHDYYKLRRGELNIEDINFNQIVTEQNDIFKLTAKMNKVNFTFDVLQDESFRSDKMAVKLILNNLLSNAFKYQNKSNNEKMVDLKIRVATGKATINIKDNGIGIDEKHFSEIFNMFFRATSQEVGSGFGLYNVKEAVKKLNGEVKVNSVPDMGSVFEVTIPNK